MEIKSYLNIKKDKDYKRNYESYLLSFKGDENRIIYQRNILNTKLEVIGYYFSKINDISKEILFDSKNRENVTVGFRLGGYDDNSSGKVWFSDFKLEMGGRIEDNKWKFACFIFENIDVDLDEEHINIQMNDNEVRNVSQNMSRFKTSCEELSRKQYAS